MSRNILTAAEYEYRLKVAEALIEQALAWMNYNAGSRIEHRSWGEAKVIFRWEDGVVKEVRVEESSVLRQKDPGGLVAAASRPLAGGSDMKVDMPSART